MAEGGKGTYSSKNELNTGGDLRRIAGDGGTSSNTVEVQGLSAGISQELVEMYFENSRRSGGGDIVEVQIIDGVAYITFVDAETAERVVSHSSHQVAGQTLTVTLYHPPPTKPCYDDRVLVHGLNSAVTEELLIKFLLTETGAKVTEFRYGEEEGKVVVTFSKSIDFDTLKKAFKERRIESTFLQVAKVAISNCILVCNLHQSTCQDAMLLYFENKRRSGGGDVERVEMMPKERYCLVYFEDNSVIDRVLSQTHKIDGTDLEVHLHHECLGRRSSTRRSQLCLKMSNLGNKDIARLDNKRTEAPTNKTPNSVSSDHDKESDFVEVTELQENDGNAQVLHLLIKYLKQQGKKDIADVSKHMVSRSFKFHLIWNFYTQTDCGRKMLDDIVTKHHCKVFVDDHFKEFFIVQVSDEQFKEESDVKHFIDGVLDNMYISAEESLSIDSVGTDPRIQDDVRDKLKERKELDCSWIELVVEGNLLTVYTVCIKDLQQLVMQIITEVITDATKSFNSHKEIVTADFMWQTVMTRFEYLKGIGLKFPSTEITNDKNLNAFLLKGPRDEVKAAAGHLEELLKIAHKEIHEEVFSPGYQFEIFAFSEMCDYIDNSLPKLAIVWIPNHLTKTLHLFSKDPEQLKGIDKFIKGCIKEKLYPFSKDNSNLPSEKIHSIEELKKKHKGRIVINLLQSSVGLLVTTADDIFGIVDAEMQIIISSDIGEIHPETYVSEKPDGRDGQPDCNSEFSATNSDLEKNNLSPVISDSGKNIEKSLEVKDKKLFRKLFMEHMEKFNQIAKEHCVSIEISDTQSRVGFVLKGLEKEVRHVVKIICRTAKQQMQLQQDIRDVDGAAEKIHKHMTESPNAVGKPESSKISEQQLSRVHKEVDTYRTNTTIGEKEQFPKRSSEQKESAYTTDHVPSREKGSKDDEGDADNSCYICLCSKTDPKALSCGHSFCSGCIDLMYKCKPVCPVCCKIVGTLTGDQPKNGKMTVQTTKIDLAGYEGHGSIMISYDFPAGRQEPNHPSPGAWYPRMMTTAYLPNTSEGRTVCEMLQLAFERRLVFTFSQSWTRRKEGLTWNDIHHKTNPKPGGQFGYPDPEYLSRLKDELAAKGITEADLTTDETGL